MCEALENLMKDVIEERVNEKVEERINERVNEAVKRNTEQVTEQKDKEIAIKLFGQGMPMETIADVIGRSASVILQWVSPASQG